MQVRIIIISLNQGTFSGKCATLILIISLIYFFSLIKFISWYYFLFSCRSKCFDSFSPEERDGVLAKLYSMQSKTMQDVYLQSLVDHHEVKKHRSRKEEPRVRQSTFSYHVMRGSQKVPVCQKAFLSLHSVSEKRLRRLQGLLRGDKKTARSSSSNKFRDFRHWNQPNGGAY